MNQLMDQQLKEGRSLAESLVRQVRSLKLVNLRLTVLVEGQEYEVLVFQPGCCPARPPRHPGDPDFRLPVCDAS